MLHTDLIRHRMEFARAIGARQFELAPNGLYFPKQRAFVQGVYETWVNGADHQIDPNTVPVEALDYLLKAGIKGVGSIGTWYIAPFVNNVTPASTLTASTFDTTMGEFTDYDEASRGAFVVPTDPTSGSYSNAAAPAVFTAAAGVGNTTGVDIYGAAILSASAKEATNGKLLACSKFSAPRNLKAGDKLSVQYTISAASTG